MKFETRNSQPKRIAAITAFLTAALLITGCDEHQQMEEKETPPAAANVSFKEGKGLLLDPATARHIGLRVEDVGERKISETMRFAAEVYRAAAARQVAGLDDALPVVSMASAMVSAANAGRINRGSPVSVETKFGALNGRVAEVYGKGTQREVVIAITDAERQLAPGMPVTVTARTGEEKTVAAIPAGALLRTLEGTFVYTVSGDRYIRTPVQAGTMTNEFVEITDGLYAGDQVVVHPVMTLWLSELQVIRGGKACADGD